MNTSFTLRRYVLPTLGCIGHSSCHIPIRIGRQHGRITSQRILMMSSLHQGVQHQALFRGQRRHRALAEGHECKAKMIDRIRLSTSLGDMKNTADTKLPNPETHLARSHKILTSRAFASCLYIKTNSLGLWIFEILPTLLFQGLHLENCFFGADLIFAVTDACPKQVSGITCIFCQRICKHSVCRHPSDGCFRTLKTLPYYHNIYGCASIFYSSWGRHRNQMVIKTLAISDNHGFQYW